MAGSHPPRPKATPSARSTPGQRGARPNPTRTASARPAARTTHTRPARPSGFRVPIAVKYAVFTGFLLSIFLIVVGTSSYRIALTEIDRQINSKGIGLTVVAGLHLAGDPFWRNDDLTQQEQIARQRALDLLLAEMVEDSGSEGVLDIVVLEARGDSFVAAASGGAKLALRGEKDITSESAREAGVTVLSGTLSGERARSYKRAIERGGDTVGFVRVFLSAQQIEQLKSDFYQNVVFLLTLSILLGLPCVALVGGVLTRPIRTLQHDMALVAEGNLDHQSQIHSHDELETLALAFNQMTARLAEAQEQEASRKALERELSIATSIQYALLPDRVPPLDGYEMFPHYASAKEVGGDYYDFIPLGESRWAIVVADVSGKGIPGSLVMTMTRSLIRMAAREGRDPADILTRVNASLSKDMTRGMFVTLIWADLDISTGKVRIARAGHNPAYYFEAATQELHALQPSGIALGMVHDLFAPNLAIAEVQLSPGDNLVLYTDGIIEAMSPNAEEYTAERFQEVLVHYREASAREQVTGVMADVERHAAGADPSDDSTLIVIRRLS